VKLATKPVCDGTVEMMMSTEELVNGWSGPSLLFWVLLIAAAAAVLHGLSLGWRRRQHAAIEAEAREAMARAVQLLTQVDEDGGLCHYSVSNADSGQPGGADTRDGAASMSETASQVAEWPKAIVYRPVPKLGFDPRLVVLYDREPRLLVVAYPRLLPARLVWLAAGRTVVVTEEQFERLMHADDRLRAELGLEELEAVG
jgi:hypothetical protein